MRAHVRTYSVFHFDVKAGEGEEDKADLSRKLEAVDFDHLVRLGLANANPCVVSLPLHGFMSGAHTKEDTYQTASAFRDVFELLKK